MKILDIKLPFWKTMGFPRAMTGRDELVAQAQDKSTMEQVIEWGDGECPHVKPVYQKYGRKIIRKNCDYCWQELKTGGK